MDYNYYSFGYAGQRHPSLGQQVADVSWWPKQSAWEISGLDMGYWTSDNEEWYQRQLCTISAHLQEGRPVQGLLKNAKQWRNALKSNKRELDKISCANRRAAENFFTTLK